MTWINISCVMYKRFISKLTLVNLLILLHLCITIKMDWLTQPIYDNTGYSNYLIITEPNT